MPDSAAPDSGLGPASEALPDAIITADRSGVVVYANDAAGRMFGTAREGLRGRPVTDLLPERLHARCREALERHRENGSSTIPRTPFEVTALRHDRSEFPIEASVGSWARGGATFFTAVLRDLSGRVRGEGDARAELERLERRLRAKDEFSGMVAHELRNPLGAICAAVRALESADRNRAANLREIIERQSERLSRLVKDILDVTRFDTGKVELQRRPVDLARIVRSCVSTFKAAGITSKHVLEVDVEPAWVEGDTTRLEQVVGNLLDNAVKYTNPGGHIRVEVRASGSTSALRVRDDGAGIPSELLPKVFDLYEQGLSGRTPASGLGIGLALVRRLTELHGGSVSVASGGPGCGAEFTVRLPAYTSAE